MQLRTLLRRSNEPWALSEFKTFPFFFLACKSPCFYKRTWEELHRLQSGISILNANKTLCPHRRSPRLHEGKKGRIHALGGDIFKLRS